MIGRTLGHYQILTLIGRGGMGEVYRARDSTLERDVALKILPPDMAADPARLERFRREAKTVAGLNHPHIVTLHSVEEADGVHFMTMELVEGKCLDPAPGSVPMAGTAVLDTGIAIADALAAAHAHDVVHRDLKPANVMLASDGRIKVLDFGLARATRSPVNLTQASPLTTEGTVIGTLLYMSPEQVRGETVGPASDIFSLGTMLYQLASGKHPFSASYEHAIGYAIVNETAVPLSKLRADLPPALSDIVMRCLEKDPANRYASATEVRDALRAVRENAGATAPRRRRRRPQWIAVTAVTAVILGGAFLLLGRDRGVSASKSIAVLPFVNMSSDKEQEYFSDGLSEELLNTLVRVPDLKVIGRTSSFSFKGSNEDVHTIGEKLGVAHVLSGSVRKSGDSVRISVQLVKVSDGLNLWSQTYDRRIDDIFVVQDDIARSVAQKLRGTLLGTGVSAATNPEVYDLILQARYVLQAGAPESIPTAREMLERALRIAPDYAPAWSEMGLVNRREYEAATTVVDRQEAVRKLRATLTRALELDPDLAIARSRMALVQFQAWEFQDAARSVERALAADPKSAPVLGNAAVIYLFTGRFDESIRLGEHLLELEPLNMNAFINLSAAYIPTHRLDEAEAVLRRGLELRPESPRAYYNLSHIYLARRQPEEARAAFEKCLDLIGPGETARRFVDAMVEYVAGNDAASRSAADEYEKLAGKDDPYSCAQVRAVRRENDAAFAWLDQAADARDPIVANILSDPHLTALHSDPRWSRLLKKIGLPTENT